MADVESIACALVTLLILMAVFFAGYGVFNLIITYITPMREWKDREVAKFESLKSDDGDTNYGDGWEDL